MRQPKLVVRAAAEVEGMVTFFVLVGALIEGLDSQRAFRALVEVGLDPEHAYNVTKDWQMTQSMAILTGTSAETDAMGVFMDNVENWWDVPFLSKIDHVAHPKDSISGDT